MASLEGQTIASTYKQLLKITSEGVGADASAKYIEDGLGTDTALSLSTTRAGIGTASPSGLLEIEKNITSDTALRGLVVDLSKDTSAANSGQTLIGADIDIDITAIKDIHADIKGLNIDVLATLTDTGSHNASLYGIDVDVTPYASSNETVYGIKVNVDDNSVAATDYGLHVTAANNYFSGNLGVGTASPVSLLYLEEDNTTNVTDAASMISNSSLTINGNSSDGSDVIRMGAMSNATGDYFIEVSNSAGNAAYSLLLNPINGGKVGIGTTNPSSYNSNTNNLVIRDSGSGGITISTGASSTGYLAFNDGEDTTIEGLIAYNQSNDTMSFRTASVDNRLVIDGSGRMVASSVVSSSPSTDYLDGDASLYLANSGSSGTMIKFGDTNAGLVYGGSGTGTFKIMQRENTAVFIDASRKVGIGHTSPQYGLTMAQGSTDAQKIGWEDGSDNKRGAILVNSSNDAMEFMTGTSDAVRMTIASDGVVSITASSNSPSSLNVIASGSGQAPNDAKVYVSKNSSADWSFMGIGGADDYGLKLNGAGNYALMIADHNQSSDVRSRISFNGYVYSTDGSIHDIDSDERKKEDIGFVESQWQMLKDLPLQKFKWKDRRAGDKYSYGWIAQNVQQKYPELVNIVPQTKEDIENEVEDPEYLTVMTGDIHRLAIKVLQEAMDKIETLEAKVEALENA